VSAHRTPIAHRTKGTIRKIFGNDAVTGSPGAIRRDDRPVAEPERYIVVVDGSNVIGTVPDGWWRDRRAAARRLLGRLQCLRARSGNELILVLDVIDPELRAGDHGGVVVQYATRRGPNAADDRIRELVAGLDGRQVEVVTSDRALAADMRPSAHVVPATAFLSRLDAAGC
jgi:8-oxo-dGTP diphosphatase